MKSFIFFLSFISLNVYAQLPNLNSVCMDIHNSIVSNWNAKLITSEGRTREFSFDVLNREDNLNARFVTIGKFTTPLIFKNEKILLKSGQLIETCSLNWLNQNGLMNKLTLTRTGSLSPNKHVHLYIQPLHFVGQVTGQNVNVDLISGDNGMF